MEPAWSPGRLADTSGPDAPSEGRAVPLWRILGPLEVVSDVGPVVVPGQRPRRVLARLLLDPGRVVSADQLIEAIWDDEPPASAEVTLRSHVASLRRALVAGQVDASVTTRPPGYLLAVGPEQVDVHRFEQGVAEGRAQLANGSSQAAAGTLRAALALWRGPLLDDLGPPPFAQAEAARLEELRLTALEAQVDADLASGRHHDLVGELEALVDAHPFREGFSGRLMLALVRSDRQAEALETYRLARKRLKDELGIEPGRTLSQLEAAILRQDPALHRGSVPDAPLAAVRSRDRPSPSSSATSLDVVRRHPMVGRTEELTQLRTSWREVRDGASRITFLAGEAGVGKTRLAAEVAAEAAASGAIVLVGHCERAAAIPYAPITDAFDASAEVAEVVGAASASVIQPLVKGRVTRPRGVEDDDPAVPSDPQDGRTALFSAVAAVLAEVTARAPTLFVVEDAEDLDAASARLLRHLARHLPAHLLVLICFRDPPGSRKAPLRELLADTGRSGLADRLELGPLPEAELAELVTAWVGEPASPRAVHALWSSTGGNPFYASALVQELVARGGVDAAATATWRIPSGVRDVLRDRLRDLTGPTQDIVACAAVLGREVEAEPLAQVADRPEHEVIDALEEAVAAGWLIHAGRAWQTRYAFRHPLMRDAVHADLTAPRRQRLHLRAAAALERGVLEKPAELAAVAVHLRAAGGLGDPDRAATLSLAAADAAAELYAWDEAVVHAEAAVEILEGIAAAPIVQADAVRRTAELLTDSTLDLSRAVHLFEVALGLYRAAGDDAAVAAVRGRLGLVLSLHHSVMDVPGALEHLAAAEPSLTAGEPAFEVQYATALATLFGLQTRRGIEASLRAAGLADELDRDDLVALVRPTEASLRFNAGELAASQVLLDEAWRAIRDADDPRLTWEVATAGAMHSNIALLDPATSRTWCERALSQPRFHRLTLPLEGITDQLVHALAVQGELTAARTRAGPLPHDAVSRRLLMFLDGDWEAAERSWTEALARDLDRGDLLNAVLNAGWAAGARWLLGHRGAAVEALHRALELCLDQGPALPVELMVRADLARFLAAEGDVGEASLHLARCDGILGEKERWCGRAGHVELARAAVLEAREQHADADAAWTRALEVFAAYRLPWWQAETRLAWAVALAARGNALAADAQERAASALYDDLDAHRRWRRAIATV